MLKDRGHRSVQQLLRSHYYCRTTPRFAASKGSVVTDSVSCATQLETCLWFWSSISTHSSLRHGISLLHARQTQKLAAISTCLTGVLLVFPPQMPLDQIPTTDFDHSLSTPETATWCARLRFSGHVPFRSSHDATVLTIISTRPPLPLDCNEVRPAPRPAPSPLLTSHRPSHHSHPCTTRSTRPRWFHPANMELPFPTSPLHPGSGLIPVWR